MKELKKWVISLGKSSFSLAAAAWPDQNIFCFFGTKSHGSAFCPERAAGEAGDSILQMHPFLSPVKPVLCLVMKYKALCRSGKLPPRALYCQGTSSSFGSCSQQFLSNLGLICASNCFLFVCLYVSCCFPALGVDWHLNSPRKPYMLQPWSQQRPVLRNIWRHWIHPAPPACKRESQKKIKKPAVARALPWVMGSTCLRGILFTECAATGLIEWNKNTKWETHGQLSQMNWRREHKLIFKLSSFPPPSHPSPCNSHKHPHLERLKQNSCLYQICLSSVHCFQQHKQHWLSSFCCN